MRIDVPRQGRVIGFYGKERQSMIHCEELAELIQAISKMRRAPDDPTVDSGEAHSNLVEEVADVCISIEQLQEIYGISDREIQWVVDKKCARQEERIHDALRRKLEG